MNLIQKQQRFAELLKRVYDRAIERKDGARLRHLTRVISRAYQESPEELGDYFEAKDELVAGIATSAYYYLTGNIIPIQKIEYGGLGAIITENLEKVTSFHPGCVFGTGRDLGTESSKRLEFNRCQLQFARLSGTALKKSINSDDALKYSENSEYSLWYSENSGNSLQYSKNSDCALQTSENSGNSLQHSINSGHSFLGGSRNSGNALQYSCNFGNSLNVSTNSGNSLQYSVNLGESLRNSTNSGFALFKSRNSQNSLYRTYNSEFVLFLSKNSDKALDDSPTPDYRKNLKNSLRNEPPKLRYQDIFGEIKEELDKFGGTELALWKLEYLLEKEGRGAYSNPQFFKEGGTRYVFTVEWGLFKRKRIIKVDKPLSALASPRARRDVGERGCGTTNELELISQIEHSGITQLLDYFTPGVSGKYGLSGSITIEEFFPDSKSLEELVNERNPDVREHYDSIHQQVFSTMREINNSGILHRDLKPSNILIQKKGDEVIVKITDWANACRKDHPQKKYMPTAGGHLITDPLLMTAFTRVEAAYSESSEVYAFESCMVYAKLGRYLFDYNPDTGTGKIFGTDESLLDENGRLDIDKHNEVLRNLDQIDSYYNTCYEYYGICVKRGLTLDRSKRYKSFDELFKHSGELFEEYDPDRQ